MNHMCFLQIAVVDIMVIIGFGFWILVGNIKAEINAEIKVSKDNPFRFISCRFESAIPIGLMLTAIARNTLR